MTSAATRNRIRIATGLTFALFGVVPVFTAPAFAGTVAEQRARLPPPAECDDPVEGIWQSHDHRASWGQWEMFSLEIHRVGDSDKLTGTIVNHFWNGPKDESEPPPCTGGMRVKIGMDAEGTINGDQIQFGGIGEWRVDEAICGRFWGGYNLDNFTGTVDWDLLEFQSKNNDGGAAVNMPTVFRRIECFEGHGKKADPADDGPRVAVAPPAFYPPEEGQASGCGFR